MNVKYRNHTTTQTPDVERYLIIQAIFLCSCKVNKTLLLHHCFIDVGETMVTKPQQWSQLSYHTFVFVSNKSKQYISVCSRLMPAMTKVVNNRCIANKTEPVMWQA